MARTINDAIYGSILGATFGKTDLEESLEIQAIVKVIESIKKHDDFWLDDIRVNLTTINGLTENCAPNDGMVLCWIYLAAFSDIFVNHKMFDNIIEQICRTTHDCDETANASLEYCHLLHDVFFRYTDKDDILEILPELDILAGDVPVDRNVRRILMASIWAFVHSDSFDSAMTNCRELTGDSKSIEWIYIVTGTLAGLYYGIDASTNSKEFNDFVKPLIF